MDRITRGHGRPGRERRYRAWYRHITLSMLAHAFLAVTAHAARPAQAPPQPPEVARASGNADGEPAEKGT